MIHHDRIMMHHIMKQLNLLPGTCFDVVCCRSLTSSPLCGLVGLECVPSLGPRDTTRRSWDVNVAMGG